MLSNFTLFLNSAYDLEAHSDFEVVLKALLLRIIIELEAYTRQSFFWLMLCLHSEY